jgi:hypothetical protein
MIEYIFGLIFLIWIKDFFNYNKNKKNEYDNKEKNIFKINYDNDNDKDYIFITNESKYGLVNIDKEDEFIKEYSKFNLEDELNILIYVSGGEITPSDAIFHILSKHEGVINIYIPTYAYSAGSMLALCGDNIYMNEYSLLSPVDPQIEYNDEIDQISVKSMISLKETIGIKNLNYQEILRYYDCQLLYDDNIRNLKKALKRNLNKYSRYKIDKIIKHFAYGIYPHEKQFNVDELFDIGLNILTPVPDKYNKIFKKYKR